MAERCMADDASSGLDLMMNDRFAPVRYVQYRTSTRTVAVCPRPQKIWYSTVLVLVRAAGDTRHETIRYDSVWYVMCFRMCTNTFD